MCNNIKTCMNTIDGQMHVYKSKVLTDKFLGSFFVVVVVGQTHAAYSVNLLILCKIFPLKFSQTKCPGNLEFTIASSTRSMTVKVVIYKHRLFPPATSQVLLKLVH